MNFEEAKTNRPGFATFKNFFGYSEDGIYYGQDKLITTPTVEEHPDENGLGHAYFYSMKKFSDKVAQVRLTSIKNAPKNKLRGTVEITYYALALRKKVYALQSFLKKIVRIRRIYADL